MNHLSSLWPCLLVVFLLVGCPRTPDVTSRPTGKLSIQCEPGDAMLFVDDKYVGTIDSLRGRAVALPEGLHRLEVRKEGYFAHFAEVKVVRGVRQKLEVELRKEPF